MALILGLGTIAFPYATELTGEPVAAVCLFTAFYLLATFFTRPSSLRAFAAGFLAGWAVLNDYPVVLVAAAIGIYALFKLRDLKYLAAFSTGAAITVAIMLAFNWGAFGNPFFFSYQAFKLAPTENRQFPEQAVGFVGLTYPKMRILWNVLLDPQRGLFFCNPVLLLSIVGVGYFARVKRWRAEFVVTVYSFVVLILFNAAYGESIVSWGGGTATGPRQIVASVPFMVLALAFLPAAFNWLLGRDRRAFGRDHADGDLDQSALPVRVRQSGARLRAAAIHARRLRHQPRRLLRRRHDRPRLGRIQLGQALRDAPARFSCGRSRRSGCSVRTICRKRSACGAIGGSRHLKQIAAGVGIAALFLLSMNQRVMQAVSCRSGQHGLLGRYYVGDDCGSSAPHIVRVDRQLDFNQISEMGAMPFPSCDIWRGQLIAPKTGDYEFTIDVDDSGWVTSTAHR